jgi:hypothetical protein
MALEEIDVSRFPSWSTVRVGCASPVGEHDDMQRGGSA